MTISTPRDANRIPTLIGTLDSDGVTPVSVVVNPTDHGLGVSDGTTGTSFAQTTSQRDANRVPAIWGISSADGVTPIYIACNSSGQILIQST